MAVDDRSAPQPSDEVRFVAAGGDGRAATPVLGATTTPWVLHLLRRFRAAAPSMLVCPHLAADPDEPATWLAPIAELRACRRPGCAAAVLAVLEERLGHPTADEPPRCTTCGRVGIAVRGVGVAAGPTMLRGTVCEDCLAAEPVPTTASDLDPAVDVVHGSGPGSGADVEPLDEPLDVDPEELAAVPGRVPFDAAGRRALRRGWLLARACCRTTAPGLGPERAVLAGLLVRAAKLAEGLASPARPDPTFGDDLVLRALVETTTDLRWLLRADAPERSRATAAFRDPAPAGRRPADTRERLVALGRGADVEPLLGATPDLVPGSWDELVALHLAARPGGYAADLDHRVADPLRALVAGEHLSLACADYAARLPAGVDASEVRRLADEVTTLRADVERALAATSPTPGDGA